MLACNHLEPTSFNRHLTHDVIAGEDGIQIEPRLLARQPFLNDFGHKHKSALRCLLRAGLATAEAGSTYLPLLDACVKGFDVRRSPHGLRLDDMVIERSQRFIDVNDLESSTVLMRNNLNVEFQARDQQTYTAAVPSNSPPSIRLPSCQGLAPARTPCRRRRRLPLADLCVNARRD